MEKKEIMRRMYIIMDDAGRKELKTASDILSLHGNDVSIICEDIEKNHQSPTMASHVQGYSDHLSNIRKNTNTQNMLDFVWNDLLIKINAAPTQMHLVFVVILLLPIVNKFYKELQNEGSRDQK